MSLGTRIALGYLVLIALLGGIAFYQVSLVRRVHRTNEHLAATGVPAVEELQELRDRIGRLREFTAKALLLGDPEYGRELDPLRRAFGNHLEALSERLGGTPEAGRLAAVAAAWRAYVERAPEERTALAAADAARRARLESELEGALAGIDDLLGEALEASRAALQREVEASARVADWAARVSRWTAIATLAAAVLLAAAIVRSVTGPLHRLGRAAREVARGRFAHRVEPVGGQELAALAREFNRMAERLGELDRLKKDFVSNVSHELKAPLASIEETHRLLLEELPGPLNERQKGLLAATRRSVHRLSALIGELLDLARLEAGQAGYEFADVDLVEIARTAIDELEALGRDKAIEVRTEFEPPRLEISGDGRHLLQVLRNLISNAIKFSPAGSRVSVVVGREDGGARLSVADRGPGVADADKERIFERFHRVYRDGQAVPGTGLGLAIAQRIVQDHGGRLWVEDNLPTGSVFRVVLPRRRAAPAATDEATLDDTPDPKRAIES